MQDFISVKNDKFENEEFNISNNDSYYFIKSNVQAEDVINIPHSHSVYNSDDDINIGISELVNTNYTIYENYDINI